MGRRSVYRGRLLLLALLLLGVVWLGHSLGWEGIRARFSPAPESLTIEQQTEKLIADMTPEEKIGQLLMIGIQGTEVNDDSRYMLNAYHAGGIILFDRNVVSLEQVTELNRGLQACSPKVPLFIAIDEEGGNVSRMKNAMPSAPSEEEIGRSGDPALAGQWAGRVGTRLRECGFNVDFAPVADIAMPYGRSYSREAGVAAEFVQAAADGYRQAGIFYSLKHFPGIGRGAVDSHIDAVTVTASREEMEQTDFVPFRQRIAADDPDGWFVMVSHLTYPALDKDAPASLSAKIVTGLLREEMGWQGLIITDDMEMGAISRHYSFGEAAVRAVQAGVDVVLVCHEYEHEQAAYDALLQALRDGTLREQRVDESLRRILRAKLQLAARE